MADAFHEAAVTKECIGVVVDYREAFLVELGSKHLFCQCHADGVGNALAKGTGGGLYAGCRFIFRVSSGAAVQLSEILQVLKSEVIAAVLQE